MIAFCAFCVALFVCLFPLFNAVCMAPLGFFFWPYRYYYNYHDHKYVEHDSPDERSPEDIGLLFTVTDVSMP